MIEKRSAVPGHIFVKSSMFPMSRAFLVFPMLLPFLIFVMLPSGRSLLALDCNRNGQEDASDIGGGVSQDCNANGVPDECEVMPEFIPAGHVSGTKNWIKNEISGLHSILAGRVPLWAADSADSFVRSPCFSVNV